MAYFNLGMGSIADNRSGIIYDPRLNGWNLDECGNEKEYKHTDDDHPDESL